MLDLKNDTAEMFGKPVKLRFTFSRHYCINISNDGNEEHNVPESIVLLIDESMGEDEKNKARFFFSWVEMRIRKS